MKTLTKRILSLLLALTLLVGNVPAAVFATEEAAEATVVETVAPTEAATEAAAESAAPTETATEPAAEETEAPTQPETVPAETFAPTEAVTEPVAETAEPTEMPTEPVPETEAVLETLPAPDVERIQLPVMINPLYEGIFSADDFPMGESAMDAGGNSQLLSGPAYLTIAEAAKELRRHMVSRDKTFTLYFKASSTKYETHLNSMLSTAIQHTGNAKEGDYLQWHFAGWGGKLEYYKENSTYYYTFKAEVAYTTTAAQEKELTQAVSNLINQLGIRKKSDYQKVKAVYDYICENVNYDYTNAEDADYLLKYSAYAALVKKTAVAEGYATLLYRILLELGMDTRVIAGLYADGSAHAWNITKIGDVYYNLDATIDAQNDVHAYFLRSMINFLDHYRYMEYDTAQFHKEYPMAAEDYTEGVPGVPVQYYVIGMCGDEVLFGIDHDRNLTIAGTGPMWDFTSISNSNKDNCPPWYYWINDFDHVIVEEGVTTIGKNAFHSMTKITSVTLPETLVEIGESAFESMSTLKTIELPPALKTIGDRAFSRCEKLPEIAIPDSVESLGDEAFYYCWSMKKASIGTGIKTIGDSVFHTCTALTEIAIPDSMESIGRLAFYYCVSLEKVSIGTGVKTIGDSAFSRCEKLSEIAIPDSVESLGDEAFYQCWSLKKVSIGTGVKTIGDHVFASTGLTDVTFSEGLECIGNYAFSNCKSLSRIDLPEGLLVIGSAAFAYGGLVEIDFPDNITEIKARAFVECVNLTRVNLPKNLVTLGSSAFYGCSSLSEVYMSDGVTKIENQTFDGCGALTDIKLSESLQNIGDYAFEQCASLANVDLPESLTHIGNYAFSQSGLTGVVIPSAVKEIGEQSFSRCGALEQVVLSEGLTTIGEYAFWNCPKLKTVNLPNTLTQINDHAFTSCKSLTEIVIPAGITTLGQNIFAVCSGLTKVILSEGMTTIGQGMFYNCVSLREILLPSSLETIPYQAFGNCKSLESITVPAGVTSIGDYAFVDCVALKRITFEGNAPTMKSNTFKNVIADAYYYMDGETWTADVLKGYGGTITWIGRCLEHEYSSVEVVAPTCTENGYTRHFCPVCNDGYHTDEVPLLGHDLSDWILDKEETCTTDGSRHKVCSRCDYTETEVLPRTGHTEVTDAYREPTCTESGLTEGVHCSVCNVVLVAQSEIPALGHDMGQWEVFAKPACTEDGEERKECSRCDHFETKVIPALGHAIKLDAAVAASCTETGLTEGSHCAVCSEILLAQEVIPATGHNYASNQDGIACRTCGVAVSIRISEEYLLLKQGETVKLAVEATSDDLLEAIHWDVEGEDGIITVEQDGTVTAQGVGTTHVVAELTYDDFTLSARCRVDVSENMQIGGISLSTQKATVELFSTNYAGFEVLLQLPQNYSLMAEGIDVEAEHKGIAIEKAVFADPATAEMFDILVLDDRSVQIIPKDDAVNNPKLVKGTYKSAVTVTVQGKEHTSEVLTLTVKKTMPKLTASVAAFNSFYSGQSNQIIIKNATPTNFVATSIPVWLSLSEDGVLTLKQDAPLKSASGKLSVQVETEQWRIPATVNLTVKNTYKARGLKLSATSVTAAAGNSNGISLKLLCTGKKDTLANLNVTGITAPAGYSIENFSLSDGSFILKADKGFVKGTVKLEVIFRDTTVKQALYLNVKTGNITLTPSSKTVTLNKTYGDSTTITFAASPKDYKLEDLEIRLTTSKGADKLKSGELDIVENSNQVIIRTTSKTPDKETYKLYVKAEGSKEVAVTVNVVTAEPTVTFKATGTMDLSFPDQAATVTPTFKNCGGEYTSFSYTVEELKGKTVVDDAVKDKFEVQRDGRTLKIRCVDEDITLSNSYRFKFKLTLENGQTVSNTVTLKVKRTAVKLKLSATKLTLNKWANDKGVVTITCTTKNYILGTPSVTVKDSTNQEASAKLDISYTGGKLTVATNDATVYGMTYKITLKANDYAPASVLTVSIPAKEKSDITATIKVSGKIDIIRGSSSVTVTPTYKNRALAEPVETLYVYNAAGEDVSHLFTVKANGKGGYRITKAKNAELPTGTYKVKLAATFGSAKTESKLMNMTVTMGSAKLTVKTDDVFLFANDKNDRVRVWFESTDKALNDVAKIEIKDAKYQDIFEVYDYENGTFGIGFKGDVPKNLAGTTVTLNLNVYLTGNTSAKPNATVKVKLTIMK